MCARSGGDSSGVDRTIRQALQALENGRRRARRQARGRRGARTDRRRAVLAASAAPLVLMLRRVTGVATGRGVRAGGLVRPPTGSGRAACGLPAGRAVERMPRLRIVRQPGKVTGLLPLLLPGMLIGNVAAVGSFPRFQLQSVRVCRARGLRAA